MHGGATETKCILCMEKHARSPRYHSQRFEMETWEKKINKNIGGLQDTNTEKPTTYRVGSPTISFVTKSTCQCPNR